MSPATIQPAQQIQQQAPRSGRMQEYRRGKKIEGERNKLFNNDSNNNDNDNSLLDNNNSNGNEKKVVAKDDVITTTIDGKNNDNNPYSTLLSLQQLQLSTTAITALTTDQKIVEDVDKDNDNNNPFLKQETIRTSHNSEQQYPSSPKSSPSITAALHSVDVNENDNGFSTTSVEKQEIAEDEDEYTTESSDSIEYSDYNSWFHGLCNSNIHDVYWDDIYDVCPLLGDALCQLHDRIGSILVRLGKCEISETNSTEKAEEFVKMIFDEIESNKTGKEIEELNKKYVPQFNIEHNDGMNLYDLYRMYHCDIPLLKAKSIIPYYPDDESVEKQLLYKMLPEAMKKGVIDSLEKHLYGIFELPARARIGKIRNSIKQNKELNNLKKALYEYISREGTVLE